MPGSESLSCTEFERAHGELEDDFLNHQEALLRAELGLARQRLRRYESGLRLHIRQEDERLLPIYERVDRQPALAAKVYVFEHAKLLEHVAGFWERLDELDAATVEDRPRLIIKLFDAEAFYKSLVEHHHAREHNLLFPALDALLPADERKTLIGELRAEWCAAREGEKQAGG